MSDSKANMEVVFGFTTKKGKVLTMSTGATLFTDSKEALVKMLRQYDGKLSDLVVHVDSIGVKKSNKSTDTDDSL